MFAHQGCGAAEPYPAKTLACKTFACKTIAKTGPSAQNMTGRCCRREAVSRARAVTYPSGMQDVPYMICATVPILIRDLSQVPPPHARRRQGLHTCVALSVIGRIGFIGPLTVLAYPVRQQRFYPRWGRQWGRLEKHSMKISGISIDLCLLAGHWEGLIGNPRTGQVLVAVRFVSQRTP